MTEANPQAIDPIAVFNETRDQAIVAAGTALTAMRGVRATFDRYSQTAELVAGLPLRDLGAEVGKRLSQMILLLEDVNEIAATEAAAGLAFASIVGKPGWHESDEMREVDDLHCRIDQARYELRTESFYWVGARARSTLRALPGLQKFEGAGVRNVRNKLIEHADGQDSGVLICSFASGGAAGPVVKGVRYHDQIDLWPDRGLYANATQFAVELQQRLERAIDGLQAGTVNSFPR